MIELKEKSAVAAPTTYQDWLTYFEELKEAPFAESYDPKRFSQGTFDGNGTLLAAFEGQMITTINVMLQKSTKRFTRALNECLTFQELYRVDGLFKRLKKDIQRTTFFVNLPFLPEPFKAELYVSISEQMTAFWMDTVSQLRHMALDNPNPDLEDALFFIERIKDPMR